VLNSYTVFCNNMCCLLFEGVKQWVNLLIYGIALVFRATKKFIGMLKALALLGTLFHNHSSAVTYAYCTFHITMYIQLTCTLPMRGACDPLGSGLELKRYQISVTYIHIPY
jgi:hypothetical protein